MNWIRDRRRFLIALATALLVVAAMFVPLPVTLAAGQPRALTIRARAFAYDPPTIQVQRGDTVTLKLESMDAAHGLSIDGYPVDLRAEPGRGAQATFVANHEGTFRFRCSVTCGALHPFMIGELTVTPALPLARALAAALLATLGGLAIFWK